MYKIEKLSINNFKNIVNTELELGDMNVIVGPNNSGKSNFLQVIPFLRFILNGDLEKVKEEFDTDERSKMWQEYLPNWILADNPFTDSYINVQIDFKELLLNISYKYEIELHFFYNKSLEMVPIYPNEIVEIEGEISESQYYHDDVYTPRIEISKEALYSKQENKTGKPNRIFERDENSLKFGNGVRAKLGTSVEFSPYASILRYLNLFPFGETKNALDGINDILKAPIFYFSVSELKKKSNENPLFVQNERVIWTDTLLNIAEISKDKNLKKQFDEILLKLFGIDEIDVSIWKIEAGPKFNEKERKEEIEVIFYYKTLPKKLQDFSDGTILLISLIAEIFSNKNDIIFIEEPENSIHPKALQELIKFMQEFEGKKQFIITTHSSTLLNIIKDPGTVIIADVNEKGESTLRKPKDIKALRKKLSKSFLSLGDLLYFNIDQEPADKENDTIVY